MAKKYYGIHVGHDAGIAIYNEDGELEFYSQAERVFREKHTRPGMSLSNFGDFPFPEEGDVVAISAMSSSKFNLWKENHVYDPEIERFFQKDTSEHVSWCLGNVLPKYNLHHQLCHITSSWAFRTDDKEKFCMSYDGAGHNAKGEMTCCLGGYISQTGFKREQIIPIPSSNVLHALLDGENSAGKAMGLAGYLNPTDPMNNDDFAKLIEASLGKYTNYNWTCPTLPKPHSESDLLFVAKLYKFWIEHIWTALEANINQFRKPDQGVLIGGGTALALELNTRIYDKCKDVTFGPPIDDSGQALGAATYCYFLEKGVWPKAIKTPSLQNLASPNPAMGTQEPARIARLIANGKIVALVRGKAEAGPRALGYRSLLARADKEFNLPRVSQHIKGREFYRPLAPMVTSEGFENYFIGPKGRYMQYMVKCNEHCQKSLPAIVHKDLTSRPQVVYKEDDPWLHELLTEHGKITGHPVLINTSLNGKGKPICNTLEDVQADMAGKGVEIISIA